MNFDDMKLAVEALSGGKNTVKFDDMGLPSIMVRIPLFNNVDVMAGGSNTAHPMFIINGAQIPEVFISKYQNIVMNDRAYSLPYKDPKVSLNFDNAKLYSENKGAGWHLMTNAEWAGVALWSKKNGTMPRGNNNYGADYSTAHEKGVKTYSDDGVRTCRVATGSGPASWAHDNTNEGIFDLNGNVWEWVGALRLNNGEIQVIPNNDAARIVDQTAASALWKAIMPDGSLVAPGTAGTLKVDYTAAPAAGTANFQISDSIAYPQPDDTAYGYKTFETLTAKAGVNIPEILKALGMFPLDANCGGDGFYFRNNGERLPIRGGRWSSTSNAGVFDVYLHNPRSYVYTDLGFRSAFVNL
jgi:hypothetical protein